MDSPLPVVRNDLPGGQESVSPRSSRDPLGFGRRGGGESGQAARVNKDGRHTVVSRNGPPLMRVPSVIVPEEHNYLINLNHPDFKKLTIHLASPCSFDPRMWK